MTKVMSLVRTAGSVSESDFRDYWANTYLRSILADPQLSRGIRRVVHNHTVQLAIREDAEFREGGWAGVSETWFDTREDADAYLGSAALAKTNASHSKVMSEIVHLHCTELPLWDLGLETPSVKMMAFFHPSSTMTRTQSQHYWTHEHVRFASALNDPKRYAPRYVQNHILPDYHTANSEYDFAGAPELWFYSREVAQKLFREMDGSHTKELNADEAKFSDRKRTIAFVTDECLVYSNS